VIHNSAGSKRGSRLGLRLMTAATRACWRRSTCIWQLMARPHHAPSKCSAWRFCSRRKFRWS